MKKTPSNESQFTGLEIENFLGQFPLQFLLQYGSSIDALQKHIETDLINKIPKDKLIPFKRAFLMLIIQGKESKVRLNDENIPAIFDQQLSVFLNQMISQAKDLLVELSLNNTLLSDTLAITNQLVNPVEIIHSLITAEQLTHDQMRTLWEILPENKRKKYFKNETIDADTKIEFQEGIDSLKLYRLAAKEKTNHSFMLTSDQNKQILSNLTLSQLKRHSHLSYKHTAHTIESTLSTGTQYLSSWYVFLSNYLTVILGLLTATTIKLSLVLAAGLAFVGSLSLGLTVAWQQAVENYRKEAALRMKHIINCININQLKKENEEIQARLLSQNSSTEVSTNEKIPEKTNSTPSISPDKTMSAWAYFKSWFFSPLRKLIHALKPKQSGISPLSHGLITAFFISLALVSGAFLFFTSFYTLAAVCAVTAVVSILAGVVRYKTVSQERNMEALVHASEKEIQKCHKINEFLKKQELQQSLENLNAHQDSGINSQHRTTNVLILVRERDRLLKQVSEIESKLQKISDTAANVLSSEPGQNQSGAHQHLREQFARPKNHPNDTASQSVVQLICGD